MKDAADGRERKQGMANWFQRMTGASNREYERRIRRASQISEYGAHNDHNEPVPHEDEDEGAAIVNVPRGTTMSPSARDNHNGDHA